MAYRYWVGDGGSWWSTAHWSTSSGGAGGASVPTNADTAYFDANSFSTTGQVIDCGNTKLTVLDLEMSDLDQNITMTNLSGGMSIYGSLQLSSWVTVVGSSYIYMEGPQIGGEYIDLWTSPNCSMSIWTNSNKTWALYGGTTSGTFRHDNGTLNVTSFNCSVFSCAGSNSKTINLNTGSITCTNTWDANYANLTFNAGTGTIYVTGWFYGGDKTYYKVETTSPNNTTITGNNTMTQLKTLASAYCWFANGTTNIINNLIMGNSSIIAPSSTTATITYTGITMSSKGTGISVGAGLTINTPNGLANTRYWIGNTGNWSTASNWSTLSGFVPNTTVPTSSTDVVFDSRSFSATSQTITVDALSYCKNLSVADSVISLTTFANNYELDVYGNLDLSNFSFLTGNGSYVMMGSSPTLNTAGKTIYWMILSHTGTFSLLSDLTFAVLSWSSGTGHVNTNSYNVTITTSLQGYPSATQALNLGNSILTLSDDWDLGGAFILNSGTSTIKLTGDYKTFVGYGMKYYNVEFQGISTQLWSDNTFNDLKLPMGKTTILLGTQTIYNLSTNGVASTPVTIQSINTGVTKYTLNFPTGYMMKRYYNIADCIMTGSGTLKFVNSTNAGNNTNVNFVSYPKMKYYNGTSFQDNCDLNNCDTVDGITFRSLAIGKIQFTTDGGTNWYDI
jgi:hypothetical protein